MNLKGKVAVVTGATGGIGREIVKKLDKEGVNLILVSKTESELQNLIKSLKGKDHKYYVCDLSDQDGTVRTSQRIADENKCINVLIHCAGIGIYEPIENLSLEDWNKSLNVNLNSVFIITKELISLISESKDSLILNLGSGSSIIPIASRSAYCTSKFALRGLTLSLAEEYKRIGNPKFCLITLGSTLTSFGPMSFEEKKLDMEKGKAYFTPDWVGKKLVEIIKDNDREVEYTLHPADYGLGKWKYPEPR